MCYSSSARCFYSIVQIRKKATEIQLDSVWGADLFQLDPESSNMLDDSILPLLGIRSYFHHL